MAQSYIDDQFAFSAVNGVEQKNETVSGVSKDIANGKVSNFPDHYYPNGFDLSAILQQFALNEKSKFAICATILVNVLSLLLACALNAKIGCKNFLKAFFSCITCWER